jgi:hypothetical protein
MRVNRRLAGLGIAVCVALTTPAATVFAGDDATCVPTADPSKSVARIWDEALLDAIRRDIPRPTVHARNLYHLSAAMWDAWAAYDPLADGVFVDEKLPAADVTKARNEAISYAAYRILNHRYGRAVNSADSLAEFTTTMASLCYPIDVSRSAGISPAALGNRIAITIIRAGLADGSNEQRNYGAPDYKAVNDPMIVKRSGTAMNDPNRWQPLALDEQVSQNDIPIPDKVQRNVTPHWGHVTSFAMTPQEQGLPIDPGVPPRLNDQVTDAQFRTEALEIIRRSSLLESDDEIDISPGAFGNSDLGTNDGTGYSVNPVTGEPYAPNMVKTGDYARALTEFWADGPASETPPGHWNTVANAVVDSPGFERRIGGTGDVLDPLEWDVKMYLALNGAVHDAAVAAWGAKGFYDTSRPISMIRYMGGLGQSSNPKGPSYDPDGLPLERGLVEVITRRSSRPGQRHEALRDHIGEIAIRAWQGNPEDPKTGVGGVGWILAADWVPYQLPTFVTPAFAGYISGHSTFSRSAAEVLTAMTGSAYFPGGMSEWTIPQGGLKVESGPSQDVTLQWATYYDAADQAGISRLFGGIHVPADDFNGRRTGSLCGKEAWQKALTYFDGSARA